MDFPSLLRACKLATPDFQVPRKPKIFNMIFIRNDLEVHILSLSGSNSSTPKELSS